ncbi:hypothetical protein G9A89_008859 [Geosiphon pyriformis]|nr:hypothetical protein G9A89_008859 [Geosiphon pyriformis]
MILSNLTYSTSQASFTPEPRSSHIAILLNQNIYFIGGQLSTAPKNSLRISREIFYLDLSKDDLNFGKNKSLEFIDTSVKFKSIKQDKNNEFEGVHSAAASIGFDQDRHQILFLFGGVIGSSKNISKISNNIYTISLPPSLSLESKRISNTSEITNLSIKISPTPRNQINSIKDSNEKIYIFGGQNISKMDNNMYIFDTKNSTWGYIMNGPQPFYGYTATLVPDGRVFYLGGYWTGSQKARELNEIFIFDTVASQWNVAKSISNVLLTPRAGHSAVLASNQHEIIIYGSNNEAGAGNSDSSSDDNLLVLDIITLRWRRPVIENQEQGPKGSIIFHTATLYDDFMIIAFGLRNNKPSSKINILDIKNSNFKWTNLLTRSNPPIPSQSSASSASSQSPPQNLDQIPIQPPSPTSRQTTHEEHEASETDEEERREEASKISDSELRNLRRWGIIIVSVVGASIISFGGFLFWKYHYRGSRRSFIPEMSQATINSMLSEPSAASPLPNGNGLAEYKEPPFEKPVANLQRATASSSNISKKKVPKGALHGPVEGTFSQKKRVSVDNVKHSGNEKEISLVKPGLSGGIYSNISNESSNSKVGNNTMGSGSGFFLGSAVSIFKAKRVNTSLDGGSFIGVIDFKIDEDKSFLLFSFNISLNRK